MSRIKTISAVVAAVLITSAVYGQQSAVQGGKVNMNYGSNIVRIAPITAMDIGVGFGFGYEKLFGADQNIGVILPFNILLENRNNNDFYSGAYNEDRFNTYIYFTPGVKFYPFGQRKVTYAVGPNLMLGYGANKQWQTYSDVYGVVYLEDVTTTRVRLGLLINNYVNFQVSRLFSLGLEGGLGMRYYDKTSYSGSWVYAGNGEFHNGFDITGQFSLTLGLRF
jgi:hypothetical protein